MAGMELLEGGNPANPHLPTGAAIPLPLDGPLLTFEEAGAYLRLTAASIRKLVDGRADSKDDELGARLRGWTVRLSPHRRYILREPFLVWLASFSGAPQAQAG